MTVCYKQKDSNDMNIHWTKLTCLFPEEKQCLASFIVWQAAEVIAGAKPANLINILDRELTCGGNISKIQKSIQHPV